MIKNKKKPKQLSDFKFGIYYPINTYLHNLDSRIKIITTILLITLLFIANHSITFFMVTLFLIIIAKSASLPIDIIIIFKALKWIFILTFFFALFFTPGVPLFNIGFLQATQEGLTSALYFISRIAIMVFLTSILTMTTTPFSLTNGLEKLLYPLKKIGFPVATGTLMINLSLRFVPTIIEESTRILNAQKSRGLSYESGKFKEKLGHITALLIPLIIASFKRADNLAETMEARGYVLRQTRTQFKKTQLNKPDYFALLIVITFFIGSFYLDRLF